MFAINLKNFSTVPTCSTQAAWKRALLNDALSRSKRGVRQSCLSPKGVPDGTQDFYKHGVDLGAKNNGGQPTRDSKELRAIVGRQPDHQSGGRRCRLVDQ